MMQSRQRFVADQRFDLEHLERMQSFIDDEIAKLNKNFFCPNNKIVSGWIIVNNGGLEVKVSQSIDSLLLNPERDGFEAMILRKIADSELKLTLADNATNYVEVQMSTITGSEETIVRWDPEANAGAGAEYTQNSDTCFHEEPALVSNTISFTGDDDKLQLAVVTTSGGIITGITDARDLLYHVSSDWNFGSPRTDKTIGNQSDAFQALATAIRELKGTPSWVDLGWSSAQLLKEFQNMFIIGGGNVEWEGTQGSNHLGWSAALEIYIADRTNSYTISAGNVVLTEGDCAYVIIPDDVVSGPLTVNVAAMSAVPINPASVGFDPRIQVLFFRKNNVISGWMDMPDLSSGEVAVIGLDLPTVIRSRLGIVNETTYVAYGSVNYILAADSYAVAIGKIDAEAGKQWGQLKLAKHATTFKATLSGVDKILGDAAILSQDFGAQVLRFTGAVINFQTGAVLKEDDVTALGTNFTPFSIPANQYFWYGVSLQTGSTNADNSINATVLITPAASANAVAANAPLPTLSGTKKIGAIQIFNNAGTLTVFAIRQFKTDNQAGSGALAHWDAVIGTALQVSLGIATHSGPTAFQDALNAAGSGGTVLILEGSGAIGNASITFSLGLIQGQGYNSTPGALNLSSAVDNVIIKGVRFTDNVVIDNGATGIILMDFFIDAGKTVTDNNPNNGTGINIILGISL